LDLIPQDKSLTGVKSLIPEATLSGFASHLSWCAEKSWASRSYKKTKLKLLSKMEHRLI